MCAVDVDNVASRQAHPVYPRQRSMVTAFLLRQRTKRLQDFVPRFPPEARFAEMRRHYCGISYSAPFLSLVPRLSNEHTNVLTGAEIEQIRISTYNKMKQRGDWIQALYAFTAEHACRPVATPWRHEVDASWIGIFVPVQRFSLFKGRK